MFPGLDEAVARAAELVGAELSASRASQTRRQIRDELAKHEAWRGVDFEHVEAAVRAIQAGRSGRFAMGSGVEVAIEKGRPRVVSSPRTR